MHRDGYRSFGLEVVAGFDVSAAAREWFRREVPDAAVYDNLAALVDDPAVEVLDVAAPHSRDIRKPMLEVVLTSGKPVFLCNFERNRRGASVAQRVSGPHGAVGGIPGNAGKIKIGVDSFGGFKLKKVNVYI